MSDNMVFIISIAVTFVLIVVVGYIGNKIVDKGSNAIRKREVEKYNEAHKNETRSLADRYKQK
ncbi:MAG: hypothetical protein IJ645_06395 [Ruminococcus sp.]|nr:hypothetical protein [Ruminococcus sp.]